MFSQNPFLEMKLQCIGHKHFLKIFEVIDVVLYNLLSLYISVRHVSTSTFPSVFSYMGIATFTFFYSYKLTPESHCYRQIQLL